ncbi:hypothetical protein CPT_Suzuki_028 [Stenotrophomonas phage Suzuki]|nr:hypothetical protein CPT_Suzuki_028 [Stenotrophomonas phage Suzuki]
MKIELSELPTLRDLFEELQRNDWMCEQLNATHPTAEFRVEDREKNETYTVSREELLSIFQARVEATTKHLRQRYQIDFVPSTTLAAVRADAKPAVTLAEVDEDDLTQ